MPVEMDFGYSWGIFEIHKVRGNIRTERTRHETHLSSISHTQDNLVSIYFWSFPLIPLDKSSKSKDLKKLSGLFRDTMAEEYVI